MFAFQTLGVMADAAEAIATDADVSCSETRSSSEYVCKTIIYYIPSCGTH